MPKITKFLKSAVLPKDYPEANRPEVALVGRSNAGKSSVLNALSNSKIAMVSKTPGKTRLLNFFDFGSHYRFVDMPGYGFASRGQKEIDLWQNMITDYFNTRKTLKGVVLIMDARRDWQPDEQWIAEWCEKLKLKLIVVMNKIDKFNRSELNKAEKKMKEKIPWAIIHMVSSFKKTGIEKLEEDIFVQFIKGDV
jgi:GTP-binding protein